MHKYTIENDELKVSIKESGAELASIFHLPTQREYLWQGDPAFWKRHSSILFPIVGKLVNDQYRIDDQEFQMSQHGFARDLPFALKQEEPDSIKLVLTDNTETMPRYPFSFILAAIYTLEKSRLYITYEVTNPGEETLFFSLGAHPAFNVPILPGTKRSDYALRFETPETADRLLLDAGLRTGQSEVMLEDATTLKIKDDLFDQDALIFHSLRSEQLSLIGPDDREIWRFGFSGFPYLGIWSKSSEAPFVCIEPWHGVADEKDFQGPFHQKEGVMALPGKAEFTCTHWVEIVP